MQYMLTRDDVATAALTNSGLPAILVATKCENAEDDWEVDTDSIADHRHFASCIAAYKVSAESPEVGRACLQAILRAAVAHRREESGEMFQRRRAQSNLEAPDPNLARPISQQSRHSRASSDFSLLKGFGPPNQDGRHQTSKSPRPGSSNNNPHPLLSSARGCHACKGPIKSQFSH